MDVVRLGLNKIKTLSFLNDNPTTKTKHDTRDLATGAASGSFYVLLPAWQFSAARWGLVRMADFAG